MIRLTRLNNQKFAVNPDLIKFIEQAPDTVISLTTREKIVVQETPEELIEQIIQFRRRISAPCSIEDVQADVYAVAEDEPADPPEGTRG